MTVYRRCREQGMMTDELSPVSDKQLERELAEMRRHHPQYGETLAFGHLRLKGYRVTHSRLRQAIRTTDPITSNIYVCSSLIYSQLLTYSVMVCHCHS